MSNPMLAWYAADVLDQVPMRLGLDPAYESAADLTFRDDQGVWWRPQRDESWICHGDGGWERADRPDTLEGVTPLPVGIAASAAGLDVAVEPGAPAGPADALERAVARIVEMYRTGAMVSTMAELALSDRKLIAEDGSLWTVGAQSRSWYRYGEGVWEDGDGPPEGFLAGDDARTAAEADDSHLQRWAEVGPLLPELVAAPWTAPKPPNVLVEEPRAVAGAPPPPPPPPPSTPAWTPTYTVPPEGLQAWAQPDPTGVVIANLAGGIEFRLEERRADWAHVVAENGWQGWVDGRRLVAAQPAIASPPQPSVPSPPQPVSAAAPAATEKGGSAATNTFSFSTRSVAAFAVVLSIFLPWSTLYADSATAADVPATFLFDFDADPGFPSIGTVMILLGAAVLAAEFAGRFKPYRKAVASTTVAVVVLYLVQVFRFFLDYENSILTAFSTWFTEDLSIGPWMALAAGIVLLVKKPEVS